METLPNDLLMIITKKVAAFGTQDLLNISATSKHHRQLARKKVAFKALNQDCLWYIVDPTSFPAKCRFVRRLSSSGHPFYSVAIIAFMLHQIRPDLDIIKQVLANAMKHCSDGATYFNLMLEVLAGDSSPRQSNSSCISRPLQTSSIGKLSQCHFKHDKSTLFLEFSPFPTNAPGFEVQVLFPTL